MSKEKKKSEPVLSEAAVSEIELNELLSQLNEPVESVAEEKPSTASFSDTEVKPELEKVTTKYHQALNTFYNDKLKKYMLVQIEYDIETNYCRIVSCTEFADSQPTAIYKLQKLFNLKILKREER